MKLKPLKYYRGINLINEEFIYGYLTIDPLTLLNVIQSFDIESEEISTFNIDQKRIDVYIGDDTDGNHIFENDVVRILYTDWISQDNWIECRVVYNENTKTFIGESLKENKYGEFEYHDLIPGRHGWIKVVGNIYNI